MKKRVIPAVSVTIFALLLVCGTIETTADAVQSGQKTPENIADVMQHAANDMAGTAITPGLPADAAEKEEGDSIVTALKNGDMETLVGMEFGEPFDYDVFDLSARYGNTLYYRRKNTDEDYQFRFDGEGHRFDGLECSLWEGGSFFCLKIGEDTMETVRALFGEPDAVTEENDAYDQYMVYHFEMADMLLGFKDEALRKIEYTAAEKAMDQNPGTDTPTDFEIALEAGYDRAEIIYEWNFGRGVHYHPYDDGYDESRMDTFVDDYLREQGMDPDQPAGEVYDQDGRLSVKYFYDESTQKYSFVMHEWVYYWIDYDAGIDAYEHAVYCATCSMEDAGRVGTLICTADDETGLVRETQYDEWGMRMAEVSYEQGTALPFAIISDPWNADDGDYLCREKKLWFYEEGISRDESGRIVSYEGANIDGWDSKARFLFPSEFSYDAGGRLAAIQTGLLEEDIERDWGRWTDTPYSAVMNFTYDAEGTVEHAEYSFSQWTHGGTTDSSGSIRYDSRGRMFYNSFYITHGGDVNIYLYEGDAEKPWARLDWCSFLPGIKNVYLYDPIE